jgi:hypothetical protein
VFDQVRFRCDGYKNFCHVQFQVKEMGKANKSVEKSPTRNTENGKISKKVDRLATSNRKLSTGLFNETTKNPQRPEPTDRHEVASRPGKVGGNIFEIFKIPDPLEAKKEQKLNFSRNSERRLQPRIPAKTANGRSRGQWLWSEGAPKDTEPSTEVHVDQDEQEQPSENVSQEI